MYDTSDIRKNLKDMVAGLEGVTPGPWHEMHAKRDTGSMITRVGADPDDTVIARAFDRPEYGELGKVNAAHIARCSPDTIRAIAAHVAEQEAEIFRQRESKKLYAKYADKQTAEIEQLREALHCVTRPLERTIRVLDSIAQSAAARGDTTGEMLAEGEARALRDCRHAALNRKED